MIDAEQFNRIEDMVTDSIQDLRANIIDLMVQRIMAVDYDTLIESNRLLAYKLQSSGMLLDDIINEISQRTGKSRRTIRKIFEDSFVQSVNYDNSIYEKYGIEPLQYAISEQMMSVLNDAMEQTNGELRNMTRTLADSTQTLYLKLLDEAYMKVRSGAFSYDQAIADTISEAIKEGAYIHYPSGHSERIEVATRRAVLCGVNQSSIRAAIVRCRERGWNHIIVSSHLGARTAQKGKPPYADHSAWQGKVYWLDTPDEEHESFVEVCGWGQGDGIGGWGCRHSAFAWVEGMGNPFEQYDSEENKKRYELVSKQRAKERRIRDTKIELTELRKAINQSDNDELRKRLQDKYDQKAAKLQEYNKDYKDFCEENGLKPYNERLKTAEWSAKESRMAVTAANRYQKIDRERKRLGSGKKEGRQESREPVHIGQIDVSKKEEAVKYFGEQIRNSEIENLYVIDKDGKVYYNKGESDTVDLGSLNLNDCIVLHNHPETNGIVSFGEDDYSVIQKYPKASYRLVNAEYDYRLEIIKPIDKIPYNHIYLEGIGIMESLHETDLQHCALEYLRREGYCHYVREAIDGGTKKEN